MPAKLRVARLIGLLATITTRPATELAALNLRSLDLTFELIAVTSTGAWHSN
jgi:hypothetical protein